MSVLTKNDPKYVDLLDEDSLKVAGQNFTCVSFLCPEKILKKKEVFFFEEFTKQWEMSKSISTFADFLKFLSYKYNLHIDNIMKDLNDFIKEEEDRLKSVSLSVEDDWKNFVDKNEERLNKKFNEKHNFQTNVRGVKLRGSFLTQEEAENHCKSLQKFDENHDIFVAPNYVWLPLDPDAYKLKRTEYLEPELNRLMQEKMQNEIKAKQEFDRRIQETKRKAIEENVRKAQLSGNKLTQCLDENGNLVGANTMTFDDREVANPEEQQKRFKESVENAKKMEITQKEQENAEKEWVKLSGGLEEKINEKEIMSFFK